MPFNTPGGFSSKKYSPGEKTPYYLRQANSVNQYYYLKIGRIVAVDPARLQVTVDWSITKNEGQRDGVPISFSQFNPKGFGGSLPEKGALGVFGFYDEGDGKGSPILLTYLPTGLDAALSHNPVKIKSNAEARATGTDGSGDVNEINFGQRQLTQGDSALTSKFGGSLFVNKNVEIKDGVHDSIVLREDDQSIIATSLNNYTFADGVSINIGQILRNKLRVYDDNGQKIKNYGSSVSMSCGKDNIYIVPHGDPITAETQYYTEYRVDVDEYGNGKTDLNDINSSSPLSDRDPIVSLVMGNYVGSDIRDVQKYGFPLKARIFNAANDYVGNFDLEKAIQLNNLDEPGVLGLAYALHCTKTQAFFGVDKEGHYYVHLPASVNNPLGGGRSMSLLAHGSLKEVWGASTDTNNSWDLATNGGVTWNIGSHNQDRNNRSIEIEASNGIYINVAGEDADGFAKVETFTGDISETVSGDKNSSCANLTVGSTGFMEEKIGGTYSIGVAGDMSLNVGGFKGFSETIIKEKNSIIGSRKTKIATGSDDLLIVLGNLKETLTFGQRITTVATGGISNTIGAGSFTNTIGTGSYTLSVGAGAINLTTAAGVVSMTGTAINITGTVAVSVTAPIVRVGLGAPLGGAVTGLPGIPSTFDPVVGIPYLGSMKVGIA